MLSFLVALSTHNSLFLLDILRVRWAEFLAFLHSGGISAISGICEERELAAAGLVSLLFEVRYVSHCRGKRPSFAGPSRRRWI